MPLKWARFRESVPDCLSYKPTVPKRLRLTHQSFASCNMCSEAVCLLVHNASKLRSPCKPAREPQMYKYSGCANL
ncbi:hypothetical protein B0O80DRAFT_277801 [Mortierella sp. GBAus27b]|nr:hypothetical protein B0O80DRAFT_277801 [Mortierella sp. GBAus27b]